MINSFYFSNGAKSATGINFRTSNLLFIIHFTYSWADLWSYYALDYAEYRVQLLYKTRLDEVSASAVRGEHQNGEAIATAEQIEVQVEEEWMGIGTWSSRR
jgi:hypothetical protein